jgi:hypothetical protein
MEMIVNLCMRANLLFRHLFASTGRGSCKYGDQCRYTHPHSDLESDSEISDSDSQEESDSENDLL